VLTSLSNEDFSSFGYGLSVEEGTLALAELASSSGINGLISSPKELALLRKTFGHKLYVVCPGVRPLGNADDDQARVMTPKDAIRAGADALVIGRPITCAPDMRLAAYLINKEIEEALKNNSGALS
jgi:orotidine-5'-phosphate decarboxylase